MTDTPESDLELICNALGTSLKHYMPHTKEKAINVIKEIMQRVYERGCRDARAGVNSQ